MDARGLRRLGLSRPQPRALSKDFVPRAPGLISIDLNDQHWHVWRSLAGAGYRPKVVVVEYSWDKGLWPADLVDSIFDIDSS